VALPVTDPASPDYGWSVCEVVLSAPDDRGVELYGAGGTFMIMDRPGQHREYDMRTHTPEGPALICAD
jgi:hypothetical protein